MFSYTLSLRTLLWCCERYLVQVLPETKLLWSWHDQTINICFSPQQLFYICLFIYSLSSQAFFHNSFSPSFIQTNLRFLFYVLITFYQAYKNIFLFKFLPSTSYLHSSVYYFFSSTVLYMKHASRFTLPMMLIFQHLKGAQV